MYNRQEDAVKVNKYLQTISTPVNLHIIVYPPINYLTMEWNKPHISCTSKFFSEWLILPQKKTVVVVLKKVQFSL